MALIKVTSSKLSEKAAEIERIKRELEQEITAMKSNANRFLNMWDGEAKQAFVNSVNQNTTLLQNFTNNTQKFADALKTGASSYEGGENKAKQIASSKR
jgi:WXG100 family type VII secretion target